MCGIFGLVYKNFEKLNSEEEYGKFQSLIIKTSQRGRDAFGVAFITNNHCEVYKVPQDPLKIYDSNLLKEYFINNFNMAKNTNKELVILGQCRLATNGDSILSENNQPVITDNLVGVYNGIITKSHNAEDSFDKIYDNDSDFFYKTLEKDFDKKIFSRFKGVINFISLSKKMGQLYYGTNNGSLFILEKKDFILLSSELSISDEVFGIKSEPVQKNEIHILLGENNFQNIEIIKPKKELKRCSRCILPETHPFIRFDDKGVCHYCNEHENQIVYGKERLERLLEKYRSKSGSPDCLVGVSGGRDSCYGLHLLKKEFGMNPIAYTYDWGLTTNKSRRNISIMCAELGIEHIIRSADLETKRRHIRKNINAWMHRPHLGMIPLFMAGDKDYVDYGQSLKKELGVDLTILCTGHQMEQREFMIGFAGVNQPVLKNNPDFALYPNWVKIKLAFSYGLQYILNPRYFNESFYASVRSYLISFFKSADFVYLFHYLKWDEKEMERVLKDDYGWESDAQFGQNQWRMGDGQTAFNNFIFHHVAGLTEFDTYRSHQIRAGHISREEALKLIEVENQPRYESIKEFCYLIGIPYEETVKKVLQLPTLY